MKIKEKYRIGLLIIMFLSIIGFLITCTKVDRVNPYDDKANLSPYEWAPTNLRIDDISITEKKLTWSYTDKNIEGFKILRSINNGEWESPSLILSNGLRFFNDTNVLPDTTLTYEYRLFAVAGKNQSSEVTKAIKILFPAPTEVKTEKLSDVSYELSWKDNCKGEEGYRIDKRIGDNTWQIGFRNVATNQISIVDSNIFKSMALEYRVYAYYKTYESDKIAINTVCDLPAPTGLKIIAESATIATLTWLDNSDGEDGFKIERNMNYGNWEVLSTVSANSGSYQDINFSLISMVNYRISAVAGQYTSSLSEVNISVPIVITGNADSISDSEAQCAGSINGLNIPTIIDRGICFGTINNPSLDGTHTSAGNGSGAFICTISELSENTLYFYRAYASTIVGDFYGEEKQFKTIVLPEITTISISEVTNSTATSGGNVTFDGGGTIISCGVCWSTIQNPDTSSSHSIDGIGTNVFSSSLIGLNGSTLYYVRAYATNAAGTSYGNQISFTTWADGTAIDIDSNIYNTVIIGVQEWTKENLKVTHYNTGEAIQNVEDSAQWQGLYTGAYCWYSNDESNYGNTYGALYNGYTVTDTRKLCPTGYHVPTDNEWNTLITYLGGNPYAGGKLKESGYSHWSYPNTDGSNLSGFTALPGGYRDINSYDFTEIGNYSGLWSSTEYDVSTLWIISLYCNFGFTNNGYLNKKNGFSVRCVRD